MADEYPYLQILRNKKMRTMYSEKHEINYDNLVESTKKKNIYLVILSKEQREGNEFIFLKGDT